MPATGARLKTLAAKLRSPQYRSAAIAKHAKVTIARVHRQNEQALATKLAPPRVTVDGKRGAPLTSVRADGQIVAQWNTELNPVLWVLAELQRASPVRTGRYEKSHRLYADGREISTEGPIPQAGEYIVLNDQPYARRIERGSSKQAPQGVYQVVAALALRRFGDEARIYFGYHEAPGGFVRQRGRRGKHREQLSAERNNRVPAIFILKRD